MKKSLNFKHPFTKFGDEKPVPLDLYLPLKHLWMVNDFYFFFG